MKNATRVRLGPTTSVSLLAARHANRLRHKGWRPVQKLARIQSGVIELLALCYCVITNNTQTKYMQLATRLWVRVPAAAKYCFISMFNLGIACGAKAKA